MTVMPELTGGMVGRFQEALVQADYQRTAGLFVDLLKDGQRMPDLVRHGLDAAAPYLTVPSHVMVNDAGDLSNVNYDHCVLGLRASRRMMPYLPESHRQLSMAQAVWYMPQGLDVWDQLLCEFPGHYARDDKKCGLRPGGTDENGKDRFDGPAWNAPKQWFQTDHEPDSEGTIEQRLQRMRVSIMEGDKQSAYKAALGVHRDGDPGARKALESQILFCAIIDLQDTLQQRKLQNIGHKALRARALVSLADLIGWENAQPLLYCVIPDIACFPRLYPLFDLSSAALGSRFKGDLYTLKQRNRKPMTPEETSALIETMLNGTVDQVTKQLTDLIGEGKRIIAISDAIVAAYCKHINDCIKITKQFKLDSNSPDYIGDPGEHRSWADGLSTGTLLKELLGAIERLEGARAVALTNSYLDRPTQRKPLIEALTLAASKFQNDPHIQRNDATSIEEWELTSAKDHRDDILRAWAKYVAGGIKRTTTVE